MNSEEDIFQTKVKNVVQGEKRATIKGCNVYNVLLKYKIVGIKLNSFKYKFLFPTLIIF